tara:strand:+ start:175 stop:1659 length:1485 start_codon:yes stop_codon:yes gene_type:complete
MYVNTDTLAYWTLINIKKELFMAVEYIYSDIKQPLKMVVWDLGRRCNFDCTYCTGWMHSTTAPMNKFEQYKRTADFIDKYYKIYSKNHAKDWKITVSFTGGEPAINPDFYKLLPYLKENYPYLKLNLTTNGTWSRRKGQFLLENLNSITVSYHCEGNDKQKQLVRDNLKWVREQIGDQKWKLRVNVMMHMEYFDECVDLIENFLKPNDINYIPRTVGDDGKYRSEWFKDADGAMRRTSHIYTSEQQSYIKNHWNAKNAEVANVKKPAVASLSKNTSTPAESTIDIKSNGVTQTASKSSEIEIKSLSKNTSTPAESTIDIKSNGVTQTASKSSNIEIKSDAEDGHVNKLGRMCCGGRCMTVKQDGKVTDAMFINQTNFQGFSCMVNWFFLHIEEDRDAVYHHQTCMARFSDAPKPELDKSKFGDIVNKFHDTKGPICTLSNYEPYLEWLETKFSSGSTPTITCPNTYCGCGICVVKAKDKSDFVSIANKYVEYHE